MLSTLPLRLLPLPLLVVSCFGFLNLGGDSVSGLISGRGLWSHCSAPLQKRNSINLNPDGSQFLWLPQDEYSGKTFYDRWNFYSSPDPTNGHVNYINKTAAFDSGLVYYEDDGTIIMKADDTTQLDRGVFRNSIRIESKTKYQTGLFILDLNRAPWGCAVWPAFWTVGANWPYNGEIDVIEGVHDNQHNQIAWHTGPGCLLNTSASFTGSISSSGGYNHTNCDSLINGNAGCGMTEWSRASYGPYFDSQKGGIFAMKWDENDISIWSFYRAAIPEDVTTGAPNPSEWGLPSAILDSSMCNIEKIFVNHSIIFDITFCGDWAGNSYATSGCPGTCEDRLMEPTNFENASWSINSLKVYRKQLIQTPSTSSSSQTSAMATQSAWLSYFATFLACALSLYGRIEV